MITAFQAFLFGVVILSFFIAISNSEAAERALKIFCAAGAMFFCMVLAVAVCK